LEKNPKRFTGNKARDLEKERRENEQKLQKQELILNIDSQL